MEKNLQDVARFSEQVGGLKGGENSAETSRRDMIKKCPDLAHLEAMTEPTREYLLKYVLPCVTEGLVELAKQRPDDPIEFLANFMLTQGNPKVVDPNLDLEVVKEFQKLMQSSKCQEK